MKSIKIKLSKLNIDKQNKLKNTISCLEDISKDYLLIRKQELESKQYQTFKEHYDNYRKLYPWLNSSVLQNSLRNIDSIIKSYCTWCKKKHRLVSFPTIKNISIPLRNDMFHIEKNNNTKTFNIWLKFLRTYFPMKLCDYHLKQIQDILSFSDSSIYIDSKGELYLKLVFKTNPKEQLSSKTLGIDIGIVKPIVCSDGKQFGSGKYIKHKKIEFGKKRSKHQSHKQEIISKQSNWTDDTNHKLSCKLIDYCVSNGIGVLAMENLKGNHLSNRRFRRYNWAFKDLLNKITYKAQNAGLKVISVDPKYTSQTCSICGQKDKSNRKNQSLYVCSCGAKLNADINAARNICNLLITNGLTMNQAQSALT